MTTNDPFLLALTVGTAWATLLALAPRLWPRPLTRPLPSSPPTPLAATTTRPNPISHLRWITTLGATIRRHTDLRLASSSDPTPKPDSDDPFPNPGPDPLRRHRPVPGLDPDIDPRPYTPAPDPGAAVHAPAPGPGRAVRLETQAPTDPAADNGSPAALPRDSSTHVDHPNDTPHHGHAAAHATNSATRARTSDQRTNRRTGWAALASLGLLPVAPALAPVPLACALAAPMLTARSAQRRHDATLVDQLPDVVDLLSLTTAAGLPVTAALTAIADRPGGPLGAAMGRAAAHIAAGGRLTDALTHVSNVGAQARQLVDALAHHDRYGSPLQPALERVAIEARARRRRHAEESARRLPVTLLFPLLLTTFPAFVALTVVPLLAGSLSSLSI